MSITNLLIRRQVGDRPESADHTNFDPRERGWRRRHARGADKMPLDRDRRFGTFFVNRLTEVSCRSGEAGLRD
jgi:hypothetical protein